MDQLSSVYFICKSMLCVSHGMVLGVTYAVYRFECPFLSFLKKIPSKAGLPFGRLFVHVNKYRLRSSHFKKRGSQPRVKRGVQVYVPPKRGVPTPGTPPSGSANEIHVSFLVVQLFFIERRNRYLSTTIRVYISASVSIITLTSRTFTYDTYRNKYCKDNNYLCRH